MANLQVKEIDNHLYSWLKFYAKTNNRSISQEVITILREKANSTQVKSKDVTDELLMLNWYDNRSADDIVQDIRNSKVNSSRFEETNVLFDCMTLVTNNTKHFSKIEELKLEKWK
jgi:hypothetical protein